MDVTEFRRNYRGKVEEPTDKVYFRKCDELSRYAEAMFKQQDLIGKSSDVKAVKK